MEVFQRPLRTKAELEASAGGPPAPQLPTVIYYGVSSSYVHYGNAGTTYQINPYGVRFPAGTPEIILPNDPDIAGFAITAVRHALESAPVPPMEQPETTGLNAIPLPLLAA